MTTTHTVELTTQDINDIRLAIAMVAPSLTEEEENRMKPIFIMLGNLLTK